MKKVLVVDDEPAMRLAIEEALTRKGYGVVLAEDGRYGLERLKEGGFGMVISDMNMPRMGGMELLKEVKKAAPQVPMLKIGRAHV